MAWGFARGADSRGVDIIQNCEVTGIRIDGGGVAGIETTRGYIGAKKIGIAVAGNSSRLAAMAGVRLPIESHVLQAAVTEPLKPALDTVVTSGAAHCYISQTDKGEILMGGSLDFYNSYAQRGNLPTLEHVIQGAISLFPFLSRLRLMRTWGGVMDMTMDGSPILGKLPVKGLYFDGGWCYGGFKATPAAGWCHAWTIANDEPHALNAGFRHRSLPPWRDFSTRRASGPVRRRIDAEPRGARAHRHRRCIDPQGATDMLLITCPVVRAARPHRVHLRWRRDGGTARRPGRGFRRGVARSRLPP